MNKIARVGSLCLLALLLIFLGGCSALSQQVDPTAQARSFFHPPTPISSDTPTPPSLKATAPALQSQTQTAACTNHLAYLNDITIPDGTEVQSESTLDKRWEVENTGTCNWQSSYRMRLIAGPELGAQPQQALYPARSGSRAVLRVLFRAPIQPGAYKSAWQAFDPQGEPFGDPFFIQINVK